MSDEHEVAWLRRREDWSLPQRLLFVTCVALACFFYDCLEGTATSPSPREWVLGPGMRYIANPRNPRKREYWVIGKHLYPRYYTLFPTLGPSVAITQECGRDSSLGHLFEQISLCGGAINGVALRRSSRLSRAEALQLSTFMHRHLRFSAASALPRAVYPAPRANDLVLLCRTRGHLREGLLKERCEYELGAARSGWRVGVPPPLSQRGAELLATDLNRLYGVQDANPPRR